MIKLLSIALCLFLATLQAQSQEMFCSRAHPVTPIVGVTFAQILADQPYYIIMSELSEKIAIFDNVCFSFFETVTNGTYIYYDVRTLRDGSLETSPGICQDAGPGVTYDSTQLCTSIDYTFASVEECQIDIIYRYFLYGYCKADSSTDRANEVYALTPMNTPITDYCKTRMLQTIADYGFGDRSFYFYPQEQPSHCVSQQQCSIPSRSIEGFPDLHY